MNFAAAVCFGEILWDILPTGAMPGGAPMNVAYHLQKLGLPALPISRIGNDKRGTDLIEIFKQQNTNIHLIQVDTERPTGTVNAFVKANNEVEYDIVQPVAWDFISMEEGLLPAVNNATYFVFGSLACRNATSNNTLLQLLEVAKTKVLDINLRPPHFTQTTIETLLKQADILKLNNYEVELVSGWHHQHGTIEEQVKSLQDRFKIKTILVTLGANGALLNNDGNYFHHPGYKVTVQDTVGSGDAFLAGYLAQQDKLNTPEQRLEFANALGAFVATKAGACPLYSLDDVYKIMEEGTKDQNTP